MKDEKKLVVYQLKYDDQNFWAYVSNFLHKFYRKAALSKNEVNKVITRVVQDSGKNNELIQQILDETGMFRFILRPEKLYDVGDSYNSLVCIYIEAGRLNDVVDLHKLYLILKNFETERILVIIEGGDSDFFKISHFFEWVNEQDESFYNKVYFNIVDVKGIYGNIIRMRKKKAYAFEKLLPLLEIDENTDKLLRTPLFEMAQDEEIEAVFDTAKIEVGKLDLKNSALRQLQNKRKLFENCEEKALIQVLKDMNLLTLIIFADSLIRQKKPYKNISEIYKFVHALKGHVQGYLQLTENILFHTKEKVGVFCFRLLEGDDNYVQEKYSMSEEEKKFSFFEVCISDYSGRVESGNLAQNFLSKLEDTILKDKFQGILPVHFFQDREEMDAKILSAWNYFYDDIDHIGSHYGLKIFRTQIQQSGGKFVMESHSTHRTTEGECLGVKNWNDFCMPGTSYSILMPIAFEGQYVNGQELDFGIANAVSYENDINKICNIQVCYSDTNKIKSIYADATEKQTIVNEIKNNFVRRKGKKKLIVVDASDIPEKNAELIYKALIKTARDNNQTKYIAFYNCMPEFINEFWRVAYSLFKTVPIEYILREQELQIILYTKEDYEEFVIIPNNYKKTLQLNNQINFTRETRWKTLFLRLADRKEESCQAAKETDFKFLPFDVMIKIEQQGEKLSIFEHYTKKIVDKSIQEELLGCKFEDTHMRLGSTIHVGQFYEAELLFGVNLFVERFAFLMALDLKKKLKNISKLTLYGYATYSEQLIYKLRSLLQIAYPDMDVDYVILEREAVDRGTKHTDKIRYSTYLENEKKRQQYFKRRKMVCIIPIGSTLKTNEKLINMFCEDNGAECRKNILEDYEVILVGNQENDYWKIIDDNRICSKKSSPLEPNPRFFIRFNMDYEESLQCDMCFPEKVIDEIPLIEVNAASTIPNQAFGIQKKESVLNLCTAEKIRQLEEEMRMLEDCFLYSHIKNGDAHFLFYVQTNLLMMKRRKEIEDWLRKLKGNISQEAETYNIIFCPTHTRNVGFAECINEVIFDSKAIIIHDDIDKEYRSNFFAKYSNIYLFIKKIAEERMESKIRFFYEIGRAHV